MKRHDLSPLAEAQDRIRKTLASLPPTADTWMAAELKAVLALLDRIGQHEVAAITATARKHTRTGSKRRCKHCNQLLRVLANGELEPHMLAPTPHGQPGLQCITTSTHVREHRSSHPDRRRLR